MITFEAYDYYQAQQYNLCDNVRQSLCYSCKNIINSDDVMRISQKIKRDVCKTYNDILVKEVFWSILAFHKECFFDIAGSSYIIESRQK